MQNVLIFYIPQFPSWNDRVSAEFSSNFFQFNPFSLPVFVNAMTSHNVNSLLTDWSLIITKRWDRGWNKCNKKIYIPPNANVLISTPKICLAQKNGIPLPFQFVPIGTPRSKHNWELFWCNRNIIMVYRTEMVKNAKNKP